MSTLTITTNHRPRLLLCLDDLPEQARAEFDYVGGDDSARFVKAYGSWWDVYDSQRIRVWDGTPNLGVIGTSADSPLAAWHSAITHSYWTATVFRLVDDEYGDPCVVVGWAKWD